MFTFESIYLLSFEEPLGMMKSGKDHVLMQWVDETTASLIVAVALPFTRKFLHYLPGSLGERFRAVHKCKKVSKQLFHLIHLIDSPKYYINRMRELEKAEKSEFLSQLLNTPSEEHNRPLNESEASEELIGLM